MPSSENERRLPSAGTKSARWLALVPMSALVIMALLMMPRTAPAEDVPLPTINGRALAETKNDDLRRASSARTTRLPSDVLAVGTAIRAFNKAQVRGAPPQAGTDARLRLDDALGALASSDAAQAIDMLKTLRAVQLEGFLAEVERFEADGKVSPELEELGGGFIDRMTSAGWVANGRVLMNEAQRRAAYKLVWSAAVGGERNSALALSVDEQRALYTLYLRRPHAPEVQRASLEGLRRAATDDAECAKAAASEQSAREMWLVDKIKKLGELDPSYPTSYAVGVAYYRAGRYELAVEAFRSWIDKHPDGPYSIRARNHLKAALTAYGPS